MNKIVEKYKNLSKPMKASLWFLMSGFMQRGISVLTTPIFTRILNSEEYGVYSAFNSWLEIFTVIVTLKLAAGVYMQKMVKLNDVNEKNIFTSSLLGLATTSCLIWLFLYWIFRSRINRIIDMSTILVLFMFIMMWSTVCFNFWSAKKRIDYEYKSLITVTITTAFLKPLLGIVAVFCVPNHRAEARIGAIALAEVVMYGWMFVSIFKSGKVFFEKKNWKYALNYNIPLVPHYLSQTVLNSSDRIMIKGMIGSGAAGIYGLSYNISTIMMIFNNAINNTLNPWIYQNIKSNSPKKIGKVSYALLGLIAVMNLLLIILAPEVISVFAPKEYFEARWVIPPVAMATYYRFMYCLFADFEFYFEKTKWVMCASVAGAALNVVLNLIFIKKFGFIAAAYTTLVCYMVYSGMHYWFMRKVLQKNNIEMPYNTRILLLISTIFMIIGFGFMFLYDLFFLRYLIVVLVAIGAFISREKIKTLFALMKRGK